MIHVEKSKRETSLNLKFMKENKSKMYPMKISKSNIKSFINEYNNYDSPSMDPIQEKQYETPQYGLQEEWKEKNNEAFRQK